MENSHLQPLFWAALAVLAGSGLTFFVSLNMLVNSHRPVLLRVVWISGSLAMAALAAVVLLLVQG